MAIKTTLPSNRRMFALFALIALLISVIFYNQLFSPQASENVVFSCGVDVAIAFDVAKNNNNSRNKEYTDVFKEGIAGARDAVAGSITNIADASNTWTKDTDKAMVGFSTMKEDRNRVALTTDYTSVKNAVSTVTYAGSNSDTEPGIQRALDQLRHGRTTLPKEQRILLIVSPMLNDEGASSDENRATRVAAEARKEVTVIGVQLGNSGYMNQLVTSGNLYKATTKADLQSILQGITTRKCHANATQLPIGHQLGQGCTNAFLDVAYVLDNSGSMDDSSAATYAKKFVANAQAHFVGEDQAALITYGYPTIRSGFGTNAVRFVDGFTGDIAKITNDMQTLKFDAPSSNANDGVLYASDFFQQHRRADHPGVIIVLGDSKTEFKTNNGDGLNAIQADAANRNIHYYGVSLNSDNGELKKIAEAGKGKYFSLNPANAGLIDDQVKDIVDQVFNAVADNQNSCVSIELLGDKPKIRRGGMVTLTYRYINNSRREIVNAKINQALPVANFKEDINNSQAPAPSIEVELGKLLPGVSGTITKTLKVYR